ncbi:unnamed protein product [Ilex paraguariensis]|uniref:Legumain prodomain domain-containing protein n=1 Tax=Ilex paraguariensis TaxID=185542 RepID=A0ABC8RYA1_9AQUA
MLCSSSKGGPNWSDSLVHANTHMNRVSQRDEDLWERYKRSEDGSEEKTEILKEIKDRIMHRKHLDGSAEVISIFVFADGDLHSYFSSIRPNGSPIVDDWECHKSMIRTFETYCGALGDVDMERMDIFADFCNNGVSQATMEEACMVACSGYDVGAVESFHHRLYCLN